MAIAYSLTYELTDASGESATFAIHVPTNFSLSQYTEFARSFASLVDAVVSGLVNGVGLTIAVDISGLTGNGSALSYSDVEDVAAFGFTTAENMPVMLNVPAMDEAAIVVSGTDEIDQADSDVAALITAMETGVAVTGGTIAPCDRAEVSVSTLVYARENFRPTGRTR